MSRVNIEIDGAAVTVEAGATLLEVVEAQGTRVPTLCHDPRLTPTGGCGVCALERRPAEGPWTLVPACATRVAEGDVVRSRSDAITRARQLTLSLLFGRHSSSARYRPERRGTDKRPLVCACRGHATCTLRALCLELDANPDLLGERAPKGEPVALRGGVELDMSKCVRCDRCVRICRDVADVGALGFVGRGADTLLAYARPVDLERRRACDVCAESGPLCVDTCPTDALRAPKPTRGEE
jgi:formate dehydrogenase alpha subunit